MVSIAQHVNRLGGWQTAAAALLGVAAGFYVYNTYLRAPQEVKRKNDPEIPEVIKEAQQEYKPELEVVFSI